MEVQKAQAIADSLTYGGATVTASSFFVSYVNWLDNHHHAVLAIAGICGAIASLFGMYLAYKNHRVIRRINLLKEKQLQRQLKQG